MKNRKRLLQRERGIRNVGLALVFLVAFCIVPALVFSFVVAPKLAGGLVLCAALPGLVLMGPDLGGGSGGGTLSPEQFQTKVLDGVKSIEGKVTGLETNVGTLTTQGKTHAENIKTLETNVGTLTTDLAEVRKSAMMHRTQRSARPMGGVSDECARELAAHFILHCERSGKMPALAENTKQRDSLLDIARSALGITVKAALTTGDIPLPSVYGREIVGLVSEFGVCRRRMSPYPIGMGTARPARVGTRPSFGSIAMSGAVTEKAPTMTFASLESHKIGGLVKIPRELDEQSIVPLGQFLARYGAVEFARAEDTWGFLADGSPTYENVTGIVTQGAARNVVLAAGKTKPSDATLADFRLLRTKVNKAALSGRLSAYYLDSTWENQLPSFRTAAEPNVYQRLPDGTAILDGYPIVWTDVLEPYGTAASVSKPLAVFGALSFWWMGEHGTPRIDTSEHVFFANDQLAVRFIEEIDFDYAAADATAALVTAAA